MQIILIEEGFFVPLVYLKKSCTTDNEVSYYFIQQ